MTAGLQSLLSNAFGTELVVCERKANSTAASQQWQRWRYDDRTGFIFLLTGNPGENTADSSGTVVLNIEQCCLLVHLLLLVV